MTKIDNFWVPKVDSLRVKLQLSDVKIIDTTVIDKLITINEATGQIVGETKGKPFELFKDGVKHKIWVQKRMDISTREVQTELCFLLNSKHLKERYFEGITLKTIDRLLTEINALKVIRIDKATLLKADVLDIDWCVDFQCNPETFKKTIERLKDLAKVGQKQTMETFYNKSNLGLELNQRAKQTPAKPHSKFYHKTIELNSNSFEFADKYLTGVDFQNVGRFEFNLKNRKWLEHYGMSQRVKDLGGLLKSQASIKATFQQVFQNWFIKRPPVVKSNDKWYEILLNTHRAFLTEDENLMILKMATTKVHANQRRKIFENYHNFMSANKKYNHEGLRQEFIKQFNKFFGVAELPNPNYDVRGNVIDSMNQESKNNEYDWRKDVPF